MSDRRAARSGSRGDDEALGARRQSKVKYVYRLLRPGDVSEALTSKTVYVLWPDNNTWYKGRVEECDAAAGTATIYYSETEETEEGADLSELIKDGQIAFKEPRPASHQCKAGEIEVGPGGRARQPGDPELEDSSSSSGEEDGGEEGGGKGRRKGREATVVAEEESEEEESMEDAGAKEDASDSDVSFSSAELAGRKRRRGRGGGEDTSDEEVHLEEFEKREIMRDMSDDEKPLGFRAEVIEKKQKRGQKRAAGAAAGAAAAAPAAKRPATGAGAPRRPAPQAAAAASAPQGRRRREAAAGVAFAVQAVAAVQAAAAADTSSEDEQPRSARKHRPRSAPGGGAAAGDDEEAAAEAFARQLLAKATGKAVALPGEKGGGSFYGQGKPLERRQSSMGQSEEDVRNKVRTGIQKALELVPAAEAGAAPEGGGEGGGGAAAATPSPAGVAEAVEAALYQLYGGATKEYKGKFQSLWFNLKDPHNPDLRAHVLRAEITPDAFVRMTATELASKELAEYRRKKEEEALKMSVLDAEAAARFSTAAALDARDKLAIPASVMGDKGMLAARDATPEPAGPTGSTAANGQASPSVGAPGSAGGAATPRGAAAAAGAAAGFGGVQSTELGDLQASVQLGRLPSAGEEGGAGGGAGGAGYRVSDAAAEAGEDEEYDPETAFADDEPGTKAGAGAAKPADAKAAPTAAALDWASIKAAASSAAAAERRQQAAGGQTSLEASDSLSLQQAGEGAGGQGSEPQGKRPHGSSHHHSHHHHHHHHRRENTSASPLDLPSPHEQPSGELPSPVADPGSPHSLRHLLLPPVDPSCLFGRGMWEGQFVVPGTGAFQLSADALAGSGDVAALLGDREIEVKGRLAIQKLDHFLSELKHSRSRTVTMGLLSPADDCLAGERAAFQELVSQYSSRGRTGVAAPSRDVEAYILPGACPTAERLLAAARGAAPGLVDGLVGPGGAQLALGTERLLLVLIHRKDWRPPYGFMRPIRRPRLHPAPTGPGGEAAAAAAAAPALPALPAVPGVVQPGVPAAAGGAGAAPQAAAGEGQQQAQAPVALPAGLDFGALSALAAAFGVAPAAAPEQPEQGQQAAAAAPAAPPAPPAAPAGQQGLPQMDQLQALLASLPPSVVAPAAGQDQQQRQQAGGSRQRRSRWESDQSGSEAAGQPAAGKPAAAAEATPKQRRSRWESTDEEASGGAAAGPAPGSRPGSQQGNQPAPAQPIAAPPSPGQPAGRGPPPPPPGGMQQGPFGGQQMGMQPGGMQPPGMQPPGMQPPGMFPPGPALGGGPGGFPPGPNGPGGMAGGFGPPGSGPMQAGLPPPPQMGMGFGMGPGGPGGGPPPPPPPPHGGPQQQQQQQQGPFGAGPGFPGGPMGGGMAGQPPPPPYMQQQQQQPGQGEGGMYAPHQQQQFGGGDAPPYQGPPFGGGGGRGGRYGGEGRGRGFPGGGRYGGRDGGRYGGGRFGGGGRDGGGGRFGDGSGGYGRGRGRY